jgi:hypothetical protein
VRIPPVVLIGAGLGLLGLVVYRSSGGAAGLARAATSQAINVASEVGAEGVLSIGDAIGLSRTDRDECARLLEARQWWDASFKCPAGTWLSAIRQASPVTSGESISRPPLNVIDDVHGNTWYTPIV